MCKSIRVYVSNNVLQKPVHIYWGSYVEVLKSQLNIWLASSLVEYPPATQATWVQFPAEAIVIFVLQGALPEDRDGPGQGSLYNTKFQLKKFKIV